MRAVADGELEITREFADEMSYCLGCLACQTACPAGVNYAELFETARSDIEAAARRSAGSPGRFWRGADARLPVHASAGAARRRPDAAALSAHRARSAGAAFGRDRAPAGRRCAGSSRRRRAIAARFSNALIAPREAPPGAGALYGRAADRLRAGPGLSRCQPRHRRRAAGQRLRASPRRRSQPCCGSLHAHNGDLDTAADPRAADDRSAPARSLRRDHQQRRRLRLAAIREN